MLLVVSFNTTVMKLTVLSNSTTSSLLALLHVNVSFFCRLINVIIFLSINVVVSFNTFTTEADCPLRLYHRLTARAPPCQWYVTGSSGSARMHLAKWTFAWRWVSTKCSFVLYQHIVPWFILDGLILLFIYFLSYGSYGWQIMIKS